MKQNKKKKILFVITKSNWGGAQKYVYDISTNLKDFDIAVVLGGNGILKQKLERKNIQTISVKSDRDINLIRDFIVFIQLLKIFIKQRPDIIHLNSSKIGGLGGLAGRLTNIRNIIFTVHGWAFKEDRSLLTKLTIYLISWITVLLSHNTIVVSKKDKDIGKKMWFVRKKIIHIPIALNTSEILSRDIAEKRLSFGISGNTAYSSKNRLVTIAELTKNKGLKYSIDMMEELKKQSIGLYTYTIFGEGEDADFLQKYAKQRGVAKSVYFESMGSNMPSDLSTEAAKYLKAFDIFILPSVKEGMPYVLLEAAAARLPIIATNVVELEFSHIPNIHFVKPGSALELAKKVQKISLTKEFHINTNSFQDMLENTVNLYTAKNS